MTILLLFLAGGALLSTALLGVFVRTPLARHFADMPGHRKVHQTVIPRLGGLGIILAFLLLLAIAQIFQLWVPTPRFLYSIVFASVFLLIYGTLDDVFTLGYKAKFVLQFLLAGVIVSAFELYFESFTVFGHHIPLHGMGPVISVFWLVGLMNAMNIIDGIDGLAAGVAVAGFTGVAALSYAAGSPNPVGVCVALSGAIIGFLYYNLQRRRKIFLGDTGSQFLGVMLGILTLRIHTLPTVGESMLVPLLLAGYPILDLSVAMARRFLKARNHHLGRRVTRMFHADNGHLHHRLVYSGLSHIQATALLMVLASGFTATAVVLPRVSTLGQVAVAAYLAFAVVLVLNRLGFVRRGVLGNAVRTWFVGTEPRVPQAPVRYPRYYELFSAAEARVEATAAAAAATPVAADAPAPASVSAPATATATMTTPASAAGSF